MASILNNVAALGASRQLDITSVGLSKTIKRLTTGKRVNSAPDDAAGLVISNKLNTDVRTASQAQRNANDGASWLQTADGVLEEVTNLLQRAAELAQQATSGTSGADSSTGKIALNAEFQSIITTLSDMQSKTTFNGASIFGAAAISVSVGGYSSVTLTVGTFATLAAGTDFLTTAAGATTAANDVNTAINTIGAMRGTIGASSQQLNSLANTLGIEVQNWTAASSGITDTNVGSEVVNLSKFQILNQSGISALGKADQSAQSVLALLQ